MDGDDDHHPRIHERLLSPSAAAASSNDHNLDESRSWVSSSPSSSSPSGGLTDQQARRLLEEHGPNEVDQSNEWEDLKQGLWRLICNPLVGLLAALGLLSFITGDYSTGCVISVMALVSILLNGYHQFSAEKAARALSEGFDTQARVARGPRGAKIMTVSSKDLVPGDVVLVSAGDLVPADLRMVTASRLLVNQSILTGESVPVEKFAKNQPPSQGYANTSNIADHSQFSVDLAQEEQEDLDDDQVCFMGTHVESGSAVGKVIATGDQTRVGTMADTLKGLRPRSSFDRGVDRFGGLMLKFTLIMCPCVFLIQTFKNGVSTEGFLYAVSVGVGLTPEMLPVVVTVCLALGAAQLSRVKGVLVKHLDSLPTLGQMDVLCVDKTGTLTQDSAQVEFSVTLGGTRNHNALMLAKLHSLHQTGIQNAIERAVLDADDHGLPTPTKASKFKIKALRPNANLKNVKEWPFDFDRRRASALLMPTAKQQQQQQQQHQHEQAQDHEDNAAILVMKGAPNEVMQACSTFFDTNHPDFGHGPSVEAAAASSASASSSSSSGTIASCLDGVAYQLDSKAKERARQTLRDWERQGLRAIAVAAAVGDEKKLSDAGENAGLCLIGFLFLADPPKPSAAAAVDKLREMGVAVKVLTGDSKEVSQHVCEQVGLIKKDQPKRVNGATTTKSTTKSSSSSSSDTVIITGKDINMMDDAKLAKAAMRGVIFARLQPMQKERIVRALQNSGYAVGFLGDGVNDCAALRAADVGVSVDTGLDVAKAAADVILLDKSLLALEQCIESGRHVFANVIKYVKMAASSNWGNMFSVLGASLFLPFVPMLPLQVVAGNLIYDFAQLSIPTDNVPNWHMTRPLRWDIGAIARFVVVLGPVSSIFDFITFYCAYWYFGGRDDESTFRTAWWIEGILSQLFIVFILRTAVPEPSGGPLTRPLHQGSPRRRRGWWDMDGGPSRTLVGVTILMAALSICVAQIPSIGKELEFVVLPGYYWPWLAMILFGYAALTASLMTTVLPKLLQSRGTDAIQEHGLMPIGARHNQQHELFIANGDKDIQIVIDKTV
eukprot:CAMPEP_0167784306 /NCGR_PEP_ID=MMETSP0111_2-20121227/7561_1 /TAXON_ID=91324 /ORGANISM="Lotharella globosa, Strain CCCM811" /LENGTH=1058 /DNA_ID=CAMNT_0007675357 /DNA_START=15 /DNA_END=3191 /DNA_ORIENTATION=-